MAQQQSEDAAATAVRLRETLDSQPENVSAWRALAELEIERFLFADAVQAAEAGLARCGPDTQLLIALGNAHDLNDTPSLAASAFERALALEESTDALLGLARVRVQQDRLADARALVENLKANPHTAALADGVECEILLTEDKPDQALRAVDDGIARDASLAELHNMRGMVLQELERFDDAAVAFDEAVRLEPSSAQFHFDAGVNQLNRKEYELSEQSLKKAIELRADYAAAYTNLGAALEAQDWLQDAVDAYQRAIRLAPRLAESHTQLGNLLAGVERYDEAQVCFENVLRLTPDEVAAYESLGEVLSCKGLDAEAIQVFRKAVELGSDSAGHFMAALEGEHPAAPPSKYVETLFDGYSEEFEEHLTEGLEYQVPQLLTDLVIETASRPRFESGLDLGCGTGLAGPLLKEVVDVLEGVDVSSDMMRIAEKKGVYAQLHRSELVDFLANSDRAYDLFFAADVLIYLGDLDAVFREAAKRSAHNAHFVFSVEYTDEESFRLLRTGRYAHSESYIRQLAGKYGYDVIACRPANLRKEQDKWLAGQLWVLRHPSP